MPVDGEARRWTGCSLSGIILFTILGHGVEAVVDKPIAACQITGQSRKRLQ